MKKQRKIAILVSGGMDSAVLLTEYLRRNNEVHPLYITSGNAWEKTERVWLLRLFRALGHPRLKAPVFLSLPVTDLYGQFWSLNSRNVPGSRTKADSVYLPGKNVLLVAKASVYCLQNKISGAAIGVLKTNPFPDATRAFFDSYEKTLSKGLGFPFRIHAPFLGLSKEQVIKKGHGLPLHLTFSCLQPKRNFHCGRCNKCEERKQAFRSAGIRDRTEYFR